MRPPGSARPKADADKPPDIDLGTERTINRRRVVTPGSTHAGHPTLSHLPPLQSEARKH